MFNLIQSFPSYKQITLISIKLPNGETILANYSNTIHFTANLYLHDVLRILIFYFNLTSFYNSQFLLIVD